MAGLPRISVVTSSYNLGRFIARTIDSVLAQNYPNCQHIIVDGMSTDETPQVLAGYPHLRVLREPDTGQSEAINKGFRLATGDICCFLNSDDVFLPGALHRVAREIDPARGRHVVMGRCIYIDENDEPTGREHPSAFVDHRRVLEVWKTHCIPQPATFWTAEVMRTCGLLDEGEQLVPDYELFCRYSKRFHFHFLDQVLAAYRLHLSSKTCSHTEEEVTAQALHVSWRHWGSAARLQFWRLLWSLAQQDRLKKANELAARGYALHRSGRRLAAAACLLGGFLLAPVQALRRAWRRHTAVLFPECTPAAVPADHLWLRPESLPTDTLTWRCFTRLHDDHCAGPRLRLRFHQESGQRWLEVEGAAVLNYVSVNLQLEVLIDGRLAGRFHIHRRRTFSLRIDLAHLTPGDHELEVVADSFLIPHDFVGKGDRRPLSFRLQQIRLSREPDDPPNESRWTNSAAALSAAGISPKLGRGQ